MDTVIPPHPPFSAIDVADLAGLRAVVPSELGVNGPHRLGRLRDLAAFEAPALQAARVNVYYQNGVRGTDGPPEYASNNNMIRTFIDQRTDIGKVVDTELRTPYARSLVQDILALDGALGYERGNWFMLFDQKTGIKPGERHRAPYWHTDGVGQRLYVVASCLGTLALKDSASKDIVRRLRLGGSGKGNAVESEARAADLLVEFEAGCVYLMSPNTWHRGQIAPETAQPFDRAFLAVGVNSPSPKLDL